MPPSVKKTSTNGTQDQKLQDKIKQPISKLIERNRLKMVLKNLSILKLLRSSNHRIQALHNLARRCWNSLVRVPKILRISSGSNDVCNDVGQRDEELPEARPLEKMLESEKAESVGEPKEIRPQEGPQGSPAAVPQQDKQTGPELPRTSKGHGVSTGARERQPYTRGSRVIFLKTCPHRTPMSNMQRLPVAGQLVWFEGLPTRIQLPGPRVFCRSSTLRWTTRCCTRFCSASLELPMRPSL